MINQFDAILYINLEHRVDRKESILENLRKVGANPHKIFRIDAHLDVLNGHRGCATSHIKALDFAISQGFETVLILEDDFIFTQPLEVVNQYIKPFFTDIDWDVFFLSSKVKSYEATAYKDIHRVLYACTAHSYAICNHYIPKLKALLQLALKNMEEDVFFFQTNEALHSFDRLWHTLMEQDRWYIGSQSIGTQMHSFSDIMHDSGVHIIPQTYLFDPDGQLVIRL